MSGISLGARMRACRLMAGAVFAIGVVCAAAGAAPIVDQSTLLLTYPEGTTASGSAVGRASVGTSHVQAQTVTAGVTGRLTRVDLQLYREAAAATTPLTLSIYAGSRIDPNARLVGELTIPTEQLPTRQGFDADPFVTIDVRSLLFDVEAGDVFSLQLDSSQANAAGWPAYWLFGYERYDDDFELIDSAYVEYGGGTNYLADDRDFRETLFDRGFRTFVDPTPVPAPAGATFLVLGMVGLMIRHRRSAPTAS